MAQIGTKMETYFFTEMAISLLAPDHQISVLNTQSINYQEILPYTTAIIQAKFENSTQLEREDNYMIKARSEFTDDRTNLNLPHIH